MSENQFDEFFRKKLLKYPSPVPEDMWQRILTKKDKDRKGFLPWWFMAVLIFALLTGGYFLLNTDKNTDNKKAMYPPGKPGTAIQKNPGELATKTGKNESIGTKPGTAQIKKTTNTIISGKQFDNNKTNINPGTHQHKKPAKSQNFSAKNISSGRYILKQKGQSSRSIIKSRSVNGSANIIINKAPVSSMSTYQPDENIGSEGRDSSNSPQAIKRIPLPGDSLSKKAKTSQGNKSKKERGLSSRKKKWFLDVYASPDIPFNEITSGDAAVTDFIKKSFKTNLSYTAGVGIGRSIDKRFSVKTGFQYSKIIGKKIDSNGVGIANRYMSIDVPLLIGYEIKNTDFKTTINAGVIFNLYSWYKGENIANYKNNTGISLYAGLNFVKQINNKIELFAEPHFRYRLSYMTKPQAPFNQKIHIAGVSFGLKYNF